ncbi:MAG: hypothetical protein ACPL4E_09815 [Thermoproteota archaeon]
MELKELTGAKIAIHKIHKDDADYVAGRKRLPPIKGQCHRKPPASLLPIFGLTCFLKTVK